MGVPALGDVNPIREMGYTYGKPIDRQDASVRPAHGWSWSVPATTAPPAKASSTSSARTIGTWKNMMHTSAGDAGNPAGLAHPGGYTQDFHNQLAEQLYAGDLLGNFWRFDVSGTVATGRLRVGLQQLIRSRCGIPQPVTTPPEIKIDVNNGIDRWVFVGTGKLYDETRTSPLLRYRRCTRSVTVRPRAMGACPRRRSSTGSLLGTEFVALDPLNPANKFGLASVPAKGWYHDLPAGQRIVVPRRRQAEFSPMS